DLATSEPLCRSVTGAEARGSCSPATSVSSMPVQAQGIVKAPSQAIVPASLPLLERLARNHLGSLVKRRHLPIFLGLRFLCHFQNLTCFQIDFRGTYLP